MKRSVASRNQLSPDLASLQVGETSIAAAHLDEGLAPDRGYRLLPFRLLVAHSSTLSAEAHFYVRDTAPGLAWFAELILVDGELRATCAVYEIHPADGALDWLRDEPVLEAALRRELSWLPHLSP